MATYWRVSPKFWSDPKVLGWDDDTKFLAVYILTCPHRTAEGLFRLPKRYILADLEWSQERLAKPFRQLLADGFIEYDAANSVCLIAKALKYQSPQNLNQVKAAIRHLDNLPPSPLQSQFKQLAERFSERLLERLPEGFGDPLALTQPPTPPQKETPKTAAPFEKFWDAYPRHRRTGDKGGGASKHKTGQVFARLTADEQELALSAVPNYAAYCAMPDTEFPCHATTWLNEKRWEQWAEAKQVSNVAPLRANDAFAELDRHDPENWRRQA